MLQYCYLQLICVGEYELMLAIGKLFNLFNMNGHL